MLSEDALRQMGNLERAQTETRVRKIYDLWSHGDVDAMIGEMSPDVRMSTAGHWVGAPPESRGRAEAAANLRKAGEALENIVSVLHEIMIDGDRVVVHRTAVGRWRESGRRYQCDFIDFFRFRDAMVTEFSQYPDSSWVETQTRN